MRREDNLMRYETDEGEPEILNKRQAAAFLKIKDRTLNDWMYVKKYGIHYYKLPSGAVRFSRKKLLEFLDKFYVPAIDE